MIKADWNPAEVGPFLEKWGHARLPADGHVDAQDAARLQVVFAQMAEELGDLLAQAIWHEEQCKFKKKNAFSLAMMRSDKSSDRQREAEANQNPSVRIAEAEMIEATAYRKLLELKHDSTVRSHYACKNLSHNKEVERWTGS